MLEFRITEAVEGYHDTIVEYRDLSGELYGWRAVEHWLDENCWEYDETSIECWEGDDLTEVYTVAEFFRTFMPKSIPQYMQTLMPS